MVVGQSVFQIFRYLTVGFQIEIFMHRDIYCLQASRRYPWSVHCKNHDKLVGSCATVRTGLWRHLDALQCLTDKHWRCANVRATPSERSVNQYSTRSLFSEIDIVWEVSAIYLEDSATCLNDVQYLQTVQTNWQHVQTISSSSDKLQIFVRTRKGV